MSREAHKWGESAGADEVRSLVVGLAPSEAGKRLLVALQAYIDDSFDAEHFVLAGYVASADAWEAFSREWERLLPYGLRDEQGYYFKMAEMAALPERKERVAAFYRVIEDHVLFSLSIHFKLSDFERAKRRIFVPGYKGVNWRSDALANPHYFAFRSLLDMFHSRKAEFANAVPIDQPVDFIFDDHTKKKALLGAWDEYIASRKPEIRGRYGEVPIFRDDRKFLPLQAADLFAWWIREWYETGESVEDLIKAADFGTWKGKPGAHHFIMDANEDQIAPHFCWRAAQSLPPNRWAYDLRRPGQGIAGIRGKKIR